MQDVDSESQSWRAESYEKNGRPIMGSLVRIPYSELSSTLEILQKAGVTEGDFAEVRSKPVLATAVANVFQERKLLMAKAVSADASEVLGALMQINDKETLLEIARKTPLTTVALKIAREASPELAAAIAFTHEDESVVRVALEQVPVKSLVTMVATMQPGWRKDLVLDEVQTRSER